MNARKTSVTFLFAAFACAAHAGGLEPVAPEGRDPAATWRGGMTLWGREQPYREVAPARNLAEMSYCNPCAPLFLSSDGGYLWSDDPFAFAVSNGVLSVAPAGKPPVYTRAGTTLRDAYLAAMRRHFPPSGRMPAREFFVKPQYNTWIESRLTTNNQEMVERYVEAMVSNRMPCGVVMVDDGWAEMPGDLAFDPDRFPEPRRLFAKIRGHGMLGMVWVTPYINCASDFYRQNEGSPLFYKNRRTGRDAIFNFYTGVADAACLDLTRRLNWEPVKARYDRFLREYGIDGFKFDFTDGECLRRHRSTPPDAIPAGRFPVDATEAWGDFAVWGFPIHELRAGWKFGGKPIVVRLQDKRHSWEDLRQVVPDMIAAGLLGCPFVCPDMIGGGQSDSFSHIDRKLFIRSCEVQALMPMMQFSCAPWRVLDAEGLGICRAMSELHVKFAPYVIACARKAAKGGEPIVRAMEYSYPGRGYDRCLQQYMFGDDYLVAPVVTADDSVTVLLPEGTWRDDLGVVRTGPQELRLERVPLARLPYFLRLR